MNERTPPDLTARLAALQAAGRDRITPIRFYFISAMLARAKAATSPAREEIERRAAIALEEYEAVQTEQKPVLTPKADRQLGKLAEVIGSLEQLRNTQSPAVEDSPLAKQLQEQETQLAPRRPSRELKSARSLRNAIGRASARSTLSRAASQTSTDAGPLNPEKLAISTLELVHKLSPAYANRIITQIETLLWLEKKGQGRRS